MTKQTNSKLLLRACPRCHGDLFPDLEDQDFLACLQCGRHVLASQVVEVASTTAPKTRLVPAA